MGLNENEIKELTNMVTIYYNLISRLDDNQYRLNDLYYLIEKIEKQMNVSLIEELRW